MLHDIQASVPGGSVTLGFLPVPGVCTIGGFRLWNLGTLFLSEGARNLAVWWFPWDALSRVGVSQDCQPWLDLIASGTTSLDPQGRWGGVS